MRYLNNVAMLVTLPTRPLLGELGTFVVNCLLADELLGCKFQIYGDSLDV